MLFVYGLAKPAMKAGLERHGGFTPIMLTHKLNCLGDSLSKLLPKDGAILLRECVKLKKNYWLLGVLLGC